MPTSPPKRPAPGRRYASVSEAAEYVGASAQTIHRRLAQGDLTGYWLGGRLLRIDLTELDALLATGASPKKAKGAS